MALTEGATSQATALQATSAWQARTTTPQTAVLPPQIRPTILVYPTQTVPGLAHLALTVTKAPKILRLVQNTHSEMRLVPAC